MTPEAYQFVGAIIGGAIGSLGGMALILSSISHLSDRVHNIEVKLGIKDGP